MIFRTWENSFAQGLGPRWDSIVQGQSPNEFSRACTNHLESDTTHSLRGRVTEALVIVFKLSRRRLQRGLREPGQGV